MSVSGKLTLQAFTLIRTSSSLATGSGTSAKTSVSGPPILVLSRAFIEIHARVRRCNGTNRYLVERDWLFFCGRRLGISYGARLISFDRHSCPGSAAGY